MTVIRAGWLVLASVAWPLHAEENCSGWRSADVDPTNGKFELELRTCELPYGLSAYVQIRNSSENRIALSYRLLLKDHTNKDNDIVLDAGAMMRTETCQICAKRNAGLDSWQILSAKSLDKPGVEAVVTAPAHPEAAKNHSTPVANPVVHATVVQGVQKKPEVKPVATAVVPEVAAPAAPVQNETPKPAASKMTERDGFRAEDGTIIPWDQVPPEFRPRR